ncbi:hypothetical protein GIB67_039648 [Kingdonia uniflora]|uniref:Uncharacterized protein n=1 Tax=Kingdonia uniflora TaxID=39325 RepID=A0A7J7MDJ5_9MAGN|nr:hypothetical protein GIB67_039648 [Kingdonia uniflora]
MGTREVYEEKLRSGNLQHDPTIKPGLGSPRCPRCLSLLNPNSANGEWTITAVLHDATAVELVLVQCLVQSMALIRVQFFTSDVAELPPFLLYSAVSAAFGETRVPADSNGPWLLVYDFLETYGVRLVVILIHWKTRGLVGRGKVLWHCLPFAVIWSIWLERNARKFEGKEKSKTSVLVSIKAFIFWWSKAVTDMTGPPLSRL